MRLAALMLLALPGLLAEAPLHEMGPPATREMFPLFLMPMVYQPTDPRPLGRGQWRWGLHWMEANTFQFSNVFNQGTPRDTQGRVAINRAYVEAHIQDYADLPMIYFFDEEIARFELEGRYGLTDDTDVWMRLSVQNHTGGFLDPLIEGFHRIGFEQYGRDLVLQNQLTLVVVQKGKLTFFHNEKILGKTQDPVLGITHRLVDLPPWTLSACFSLKPPITHTYDVYQSGWDQSYGLTGGWWNGGRHAFYFGAAYLHRPSGSPDYNAIGFRSGMGAHAGWEYRRWPKVQPFVQLYWQTGFLDVIPQQDFDRPSLQHDLGIHWHWTPHTTLSLHYLNNISHQGNTADMGLGLSLTSHF